MNIILCQQTRHRIIAYYTYLLSQILQKAAFLSEVLDFYTYVYKKYKNQSLILPVILIHADTSPRDTDKYNLKNNLKDNVTKYFACGSRVYGHPVLL